VPLLQQPLLQGGRPGAGRGRWPDGYRELDFQPFETLVDVLATPCED
jgi:hypothetical protein